MHKKKQSSMQNEYTSVIECAWETAKTTDLFLLRGGLGLRELALREGEDEEENDLERERERDWDGERERELERESEPE